MIENEQPVIANSLWSATANPVVPCPELQSDVSADVAIVGAGFTGLSAALHLAQMAGLLRFWRRKRRDGARQGATVGRSIRV